MTRDEINQVIRRMNTVVMEDPAFEVHTITRIKLFLEDVKQSLQKRFPETPEVVR